MGWSLFLAEDSTYHYNRWGCQGGNFSYGNWFVQNDKIVLNSDPVPEITGIENFKDESNDILKIYILGADSNVYRVYDLFYQTVDSVFRLDERFDREMLIKTGYRSPYFSINKSILSSDNNLFTFNINQYQLQFEVNDSSTDIVKVFLNMEEKRFDFTKNLFLKDEKFIIKNDTLYKTYFNGEFMDPNFPAILQ